MTKEIAPKIIKSKEDKKIDRKIIKDLKLFNTLKKMLIAGNALVNARKVKIGETTSRDIGLYLIAHVASVSTVHMMSMAIKETKDK
jgi:hypothetical protein